MHYHVKQDADLTVWDAHGVGRMVGVLGSEAGFAGSMLN